MSSDILLKKEKAESFLKEILVFYSESFAPEVTIDNEALSVQITGGDLSVFTEKDGKLLEALRIITASVINDKSSEYVKLSIDADGFRQKKNEKIRELAISIADRVKAEGESINLPDMNPYDRRIAHLTLQEDPLIKTESEGEEPHRHLVVFPAE